MAQERFERYAKIRRWLDGAMEQRPNPDKILSQLLVEEQTLTNRLTNTGQPWSLAPPYELNTNGGQSEYSLDNQTGGKVYFVARRSGDLNGTILPVGFSDFNQPNFGEWGNGRGAEWVGDYAAGSDSRYQAINRLAFYRSNDSPAALKAVVTPTPQTNETYLISFATGTLDRLQAAMETSGIAPELADYMDLRATIALLPYAYWRKDEKAEDIAYNRDRRKELAAGLLYQLQGGMVPLEKTVDAYIRNLNGPTNFSLGHWND